MNIDVEGLVEKLNAVEKKKRYTVAITPTVMELFQDECDSQGVAYGPVIEELMKTFLRQANHKK